jgi:hypothetical protein
METKVTPPATKGLIISLVLIVIGLATVFTGNTQNKAFGFVTMGLFMAAVIWGCINYANQMSGNVTFGNTFSHGFKITATVIVIMAVYTALLFLVIKPELKDIALDQARDNMSQKNMSEGDIDNAVNMTKKLFLPFAIGGVILMYGILGCVAALIGGGVAKKNPNYTPIQ